MNVNDAHLTIVETVALRTDQTDPEKLAIIYAIAKATEWNADRAIRNIEEGEQKILIILLLILIKKI